MLSQQETDLLCQVGPGTPMGEVFRRFWIPVLLSEEVPAPDTTPVAIRILGEDLLTATRTSTGGVTRRKAFAAPTTAGSTTRPASASTCRTSRVT